MLNFVSVTGTLFCIVIKGNKFHGTWKLHVARPVCDPALETIQLCSSGIIILIKRSKGSHLSNCVKLLTAQENTPWNARNLERKGQRTAQNMSMKKETHLTQNPTSTAPRQPPTRPRNHPFAHWGRAYTRWAMAPQLELPRDKHWQRVGSRRHRIVHRNKTNISIFSRKGTIENTRMFTLASSSPIAQKGSCPTSPPRQHQSTSWCTCFSCGSKDHIMSKYLELEWCERCGGFRGPSFVVSDGRVLQKQNCSPPLLSELWRQVWSITPAIYVNSAIHHS